MYGEWSQQETSGGLSPRHYGTQGEPRPIVRMGPYWMGHSSVKVRAAYTSFICLTLFPRLPYHPPHDTRPSDRNFT